MLQLSVVLGTLNRLESLMGAVASIRASCVGLESEIIVVDGGSRDGTAEYLLEQPDVRTIWQRTRLGAVEAFNAGFAAAHGTYVANLNDDMRVEGDTLRLAVDYLDTHELCGQVAIPFEDPDVPLRVEYVTAGLRHVTYRYANFGVTRRWLGEALGWWGKVYHHYGGDTELSLLVWQAGFTVDTLPGGRITHLRQRDATRIINYSNKAFKTRWERWDNNVVPIQPALV